jgi:hypothetical protein
MSHQTNIVSPYQKRVWGLWIGCMPWCLIKKILQDIMAVLNEIIFSVDPLAIAKKLSKKFSMLRYCQVKVIEKVFPRPLELFCIHVVPNLENHSWTY